MLFRNVQPMCARSHRFGYALFPALNEKRRGLNNILKRLELGSEREPSRVNECDDKSHFTAGEARPTITMDLNVCHNSPLSRSALRATFCERRPCTYGVIIHQAEMESYSSVFREMVSSFVFITRIDSVGFCLDRRDDAQ